MKNKEWTEERWFSELEDGKNGNRNLCIMVGYESTKDWEGPSGNCFVIFLQIQSSQKCSLTDGHNASSKAETFHAMH